MYFPALQKERGTEAGCPPQPAAPRMFDVAEVSMPAGPGPYPGGKDTRGALAGPGGADLKTPTDGLPLRASSSGLASLKPHISVTGSTLPVRCLFLDCSPVCSPASVGVGDGLGTVLLCIFLLSGESFHFLPRLAVLPSKGCSGQKTPPPLGVLSEPQENRTRPQKALQLLRNKGKWLAWCWGGWGE